MEAVRVFILMIACMWCCTSGHAQSEINTDALLRSLRDVNDEAVSFSDTGKAIFILQTEKNCGKCFEDVCDYARSHYAGYNIYLVIVMDYNLLALMPQRAAAKKHLLCLDDVLFHFRHGTAFQEVYSTPSPQLIIKGRRNSEYYNYSKTLAIIRPH